MFAALAFGLSYRLGAERVWRSSEERCFAVVNEMVRSGDWLVPRMDSSAAPRLNKPPLFYWAATAAAWLAGEPSVVTLRSVSVLAGLGLAGVVFAWGRSLGGFACGIASTLSLAGMTLFIVRSRYGDAEPLLALTTTLALACFERIWRTRDARLIPVLAAFVTLAFLTKATAGLLTIFAPILVWLWLHGDLGLALRPRVLFWAAISAAAGLAWYVAIAVAVPGATEQFVGFALLPVGASEPHEAATHFQSPFYYLPRFPLQTLPTGLLLVWLVADAWRTRFWRGDERVRFVGSSFVSLFAAWSLVPAKQMHYLLPLTPLFALLCGQRIARWLSPQPA